MRVEILNPLGFAGWDKLILTQPNVTFFHSSHWTRVLCDAYGYKPLYFVVRDNGKLSAVVPVMEITSFLTGKRGVSLPFTDFCQPIIGPGIRADEIWNTIREYGAKAGWKYFEIRGGSGMNLSIPPSSWCYDHVLDLSQDVQNVYGHFRNSHKRNIKKALKIGVEITLCDSLESIKEFYRLNILTRKEHGLPPQPFTFFNNIHKAAIEKKHGLLFMAHYQGKVIAGVLCLHFGKRAMYKYGASDKQYQHLRPNNLVMWKAIEWYCQQGCKSFSFGRTDQGHNGLRQFKSGWGAKEKTVHYYQYNYKNGETSGPIVKVDGWHTRIFSKMPTSILKIVGSLLYRHIG